MNWTPLTLTTPTRSHVFGGTQIRDRLGRQGLPVGRIAETWEVSDVEEDLATIVDGPFSAVRLRELTLNYPDELVGRGWRGPHFPVLTKFIDGTGLLPVHLHADDETARRLEGQPNGKTEAWHILDAWPGATALVGVKEGIGEDELREALWAEDWDRVMRRLPVRTGDTIYVPGGTLHSFGPGTLIYEIEQTSNIQQHAMPWHMEDGSPVPSEQRRRNIDKLLEELRPEQRPVFAPPLLVSDADGVQHRLCCAGPYFALERWVAASGATIRRTFDYALILSNVGAPVVLRAGDWTGRLGRAETRLLPAALGEIAIDGPADLLMGWLPDLERDVRAPLAAAGYGYDTTARLGAI